MTGNEDEALMYNWDGETSYDSLTVGKIRRSMNDAEAKNGEKINAIVHSAKENLEAVEDFMIQEVNVTEEDLELIDDFLNM